MAKVLTEKQREEKLAKIRARVADLHRSSFEDIQKNEIRKFGCGIFAEMKFLLEEIDRLNGKAAPVEEEQESEAA